MTFGRVLADGAVACVPFTLVVWVTFASRPRVWLHSLPLDIQSMAPPKTAAERHATVWLGAVVLFCFFGVPSIMTWRLHSQIPGGLSLCEAIVHLYAVWMIVNVWDLLAIDWPYAYFVDPDRPPIPGTEGARGYKDYGFHARAFAKASVFSLAIIVPVASAIWLWAS